MTDAEMQVQVRKVTDLLESAYQSARRSARNLSLLYASGGATCQDVATYNTLATGVYNTQKAILDDLRSRGVVGVPGAPPTPTLFYWADPSKGPITSCDAPLSGLGGNPQAPLPYGSLRVEFEKPAPPTNVASQLGALPVIPLWVIIVGGIAISVSIVAGIALAEWMRQRGISERVIGEVDRRTKHYEDLWAARTACVNECVSKGGVREQCYSSCARLLPEGDIRPTPEGSTWGVVALLGLAAMGAVGGIILYRRQRAG